MSRHTAMAVKRIFGRTIKTRHAMPSSRPGQEAMLTRLPSEILRNIFKTLFEEASIDLKTPHDLDQHNLIASFPILAVDERLLLEGIHVLLRHATLGIEDLTTFPRDGSAMRMLQEIRTLSIQKHQLATFRLSRQFPAHALRSSRRSFQNLRNIDINAWTTFSELDMVLLPASKHVHKMVQSAWEQRADIEEFDLCIGAYWTELAEFIQDFHKRYTIVLRFEFWVGGHLRCEAAMLNGNVIEIVVENKGQWWNKELWKETLTISWMFNLGRVRG